MKKLFIRQQKSFGFTEKDIEVGRMPLYSFFKMRLCTELAVSYGIWLGPTALFATLIDQIVKKESLFSIVLNVIFCGLCIWLAVYLYRSSNDFAEILAQKAYVKKYSTKGQALTKEDFSTLATKDDLIYTRIVNMATSGHCYEICFRILKALRTGKIFITALPAEEESFEKNGKKYTAHMLYEKDDWIFDTFTCRQYEKQDFVKTFGLPWGYGNWCYLDVANMSYEEFREKYGEEIHKQCEANDCYEKFSIRKD